MLARARSTPGHPSRSYRQVAFKLRRSTTRPPFPAAAADAGTSRSRCPDLVAACASASSSWAVQAWRPQLPNFGVAAPRYPRAASTPSVPLERAGCRSHPRGRLDLGGQVSGGPRKADVQEAAGIRLRDDAAGRADRLLRPPRLSRHARLRLRSGLAPREQLRDAQPDRAYSYSLTPHRARLTGQGSQYRAIVIGPGVTPDVDAVVLDPGTYNGPH